MNNKKLATVAKKLMFDVNENVLSKLEVEYETLLAEIKLIKEIDTTNVEPMVRVDESLTSFMREDEEGQTLPKEVILKNAPKTSGDFVAVKKVVG